MTRDGTLTEASVVVDLTGGPPRDPSPSRPDVKVASALANTLLAELASQGLSDEAMATATARVSGLLAMIASAEQRAAKTLDKLDHAEELATTDPLTGLANHRRWWEALEMEAARCARSGGHFAVAVIDLDGLKQVNDERGHLEGDLLLRVAGSTIRSTVRTSDEVARVGGDEFAILAVDHDDDKVDGLIARLAHAFETTGIEASIGAAVSDGGEPSLSTYKRADEAMYAAKRQRRDQRDRDLT
jgi:diguanylate cyclase (GGDEF)-like protein